MTVGCRYYDGIMALATQLMMKMQYKHNREQLELLDDEDVEDDVSWRLTASLIFHPFVFTSQTRVDVISLYCRNGFYSDCLTAMV